jgi:hypothetical protein
MSLLVSFVLKIVFILFISVLYSWFQFKGPNGYNQVV